MRQIQGKVRSKGYSQEPGTDYDETFSPTADMTSVRVVMQKQFRITSFYTIWM